MSFFGKRFRRVGCENMEEMIKSSNLDENTKMVLTCNAPTFYFTRKDEKHLTLNIQVEEKHLCLEITLDEEREVERLDGVKINVKYTMEGNNILRHVVKMPNGKICHFKKEYDGSMLYMTVNLEGTNVTAKVIYECIDDQVVPI